MDAVLAQRTRYLTVVLEDIDKPYNAAACCEPVMVFGVQDACDSKCQAPVFQQPCYQVRNAG